MKKKLYHNGRRVSKGEKYIAQYLDKYNISYTQEQTFEDCVNFYGNHLRFDFYLEQFNLLIEYQGHHHEKPINKYKRARIAHEKTVLHDKLKREFAESHQINLITIKYHDYKNLNNILNRIFREILGEKL